VGHAVLPPDLKTAESIEKEHGRIEVRKIAVSAEVIPHLDWPGAAQVARIERNREISGKASTETAYIVTSLTAAEAGPERLLQLSRSHWAVENRLHYVRDVTFNEDRMSVPEARENFREDRAEAIALVTGRIL
jgi:predicted transposase YbfD/YdcC